MFPFRQVRNDRTGELRCIATRTSTGQIVLRRPCPVPAGLLAHRLGLHAVEESAMGHQPWSDYDAFRDAGRPVPFLSDRQNKTYHQPTDEVSQVDFANLLLETQYLHIVTGPGNAAANPTFVADGADYARDAASVLVVQDALIRTRPPSALRTASTGVRSPPAVRRGPTSSWRRRSAMACRRR